MNSGFVIFICGLSSVTVGLQIEHKAVFMPHVKPTQPETYLCTTMKLDSDTTQYIVGFDPNATMKTAHHILLYGCEEPGTNDNVWDCGEMQGNLADDMYKQGPTCARGSQIVYAWAKDAPPLALPDGVGFKVGKGSLIQYLVLQVHYASIHHFVRTNSSDDSGVVLSFTHTPMPRSAGVYLLGTNGIIRPQSVEHMEAACTMNEDIIMHPFAFRVHTHSLGRVVAGYIVRKEGWFRHEWELIGKADPQKPQMFYPVSSPDLLVQAGDILASRCTMESDRERITRIGMTNEDEMCNFYMMYWVDGNQTARQKYCFSMGPPVYYWRSSFLFNIPNIDASSL